MRFIVFSTIFFTVMASINYYSYKRFFKKLSPNFNRYAFVIPSILMTGSIFFILDIATNLIPDSPTLYLITSAFIGLSFIMFVVAVFYDLSITVSNKVPFDNERRKTIKVLFDITMLIAAMSYMLRGFAQGIKAPGINKIKVTIKDFPVDGLSIVQLSDVHVGRTIKEDFIQDVVNRTNALQPDLVVITGDLIDLPIEDIKQDLSPLRNINAPVYFSLGNHEYFHGPVEAIEYLKTLGIQPLLNQCIQIGDEDKAFNLVGINDLVGYRIGFLEPDFKQAYRHAKQNLPTIVLAHQPKVIEMIDDYPCDLMLSGHTHGGQIFPFGFLVMTAQPYIAGLIQHSENKQIFISRGTGYWGPPIRVLAPSEISYITISAS